jgi:tight adherence protein B
VKRALLAALLGLALAAVPAAASADDGFTLTRAGNDRFPTRTWALTLPTDTELSADQVRVFENGKPVLRPTVVPAEQAEPGEFGVVIVLDTSRSMQGASIVEAMEAAREFARHRPPGQKLAVVSFDGDVHVLLPPTTDAAAIARALSAEPELAPQTRLYDGIAMGISLLKQNDVAAGSLVVLSDGADTRSQATVPQIAEQAREAQVRIYSVGLRSRSYDPGTLRTIAEEGGGAYAEADSPSELTAIYDNLGRRLGNQYLIRYQSLAGPDENVSVEVRVAGFRGGARSEYVSPPLATTPVPPFHPSIGATFWRSTLAMVVAGLLCALLVGGMTSLFLRSRRPTVRARMAQFVTLQEKEPRERRSGSLTEKVLDGTERSLQRTPWWERFTEELEIAEVRVPAAQIVVLTAAGTAIAVWLLLVIGGPLFAPVGFAVPFIVRALLKRKLNRRRAAFAEQLPDNLQVLASALRAGHSFIGALSVVVDDSSEPSRKEFRRAIADEQLGVSLREALDSVAQRMDNRELEQVAIVASLQRETGGNTAEVLDRVTETIRERSDLRRLVKTLTAQGRMSRWVVSALPVFLLVAITLINPGYMDPLFSTTVGRALLLVAGILVVAGSLVIRRIVNIKV